MDPVQIILTIGAVIAGLLVLYVGIIGALFAFGWKKVSKAHDETNDRIRRQQERFRRGL